MATKLNKISSGQQPHKVVKWWVNQCFKEHLCPPHQVNDYL